MNIDNDKKEYRISWSGDWRQPPDLRSFPQVEASVTPILHSQEVEGLWAKSYVLKYGADSHIRILENDDGGAFPVIKCGTDNRQRRLIRDEFSILLYLASHDCPVVRVHPEPLTDDAGIFGFRMEKLIEIEVANGQPYAAQIASCMKEIHQKGVIHNDLSPSNVMKSTDGRVTLIDFGRAGYISDWIHPDKRASNVSEYYSAENDVDHLKTVLGM